MATHSSILAWRIPMERRTWRAAVLRVSKSRAQLINNVVVVAGGQRRTQPYIYLYPFSSNPAPIQASNQVFF